MRRHNRTFHEIFGVRERQGDVGIEVELEGYNLPVINKNGWVSHVDGSLRALNDPDGNQHHPAEYILNNPVGYENVEKSLETLHGMLSKATIELSNRCSVHVHLNTLGMSIKQVYTWLCAYYCLEKILIEYCGEDRRGNLFCLSGTDAEYVVQCLQAAASGEGGHNEINNQHLKYAACNVYALVTHGSLEFRAHGGVQDVRRVKPWVDILMALRENSKGFENPRDVVEQFSRLTATGFARRVLGDHFKHFQWKPKLEQNLWEGVRLAQDIAWAVDWEEGKPEERAAPQPRKKGGNVAGNRILIWNAGDPENIRHGMYADRNAQLRWHDAPLRWVSPVRWAEYERAYPGGVVGDRPQGHYRRFPPLNPQHAWGDAPAMRLNP